MFKSVFTKYIVVFMLIIAASFLVLTLTLCRFYGGYSSEMATKSSDRAADSIVEVLSNGINNSNDIDLNQYVFLNKDELTSILSLLCDYTQNTVILISDNSGEVLLDSRGDILSGAISEDIMKSVYETGNRHITGNLDEYFDITYLISAKPIYDTDNIFCGIVFVGTPLEIISDVTQTIVRMVAFTCIIVMLASLIAIYSMSEKIISPIKEMSKAAKSFASGKFDVRVPVNGRDEIAELATAFNNMAASLAGLEDMRRTFLANVSHDLRTPMTTISGFIDGIIDGAIPPEKHDYYLEVIRGEVLRLSRLVGNLLDITRIQAGERKFNKTAFDICEMARLILISFEQKIEDKKLDVEFNCKKDKMIVYADRDAIYQILYNICDNAVKFSKEGGKYRISIIDRDRKVYVSVFNEGMGIPADELPFVFERFYKSDRSRGLDKTGVGLGLYIAKTIIDAHDEEIWVKSVYGENCEFVFTLPYTPEADIVIKD